jgi:tetratricopeptide (TPR) repeat protein
VTIDEMVEEAMAVAGRLVEEFSQSPHSHNLLGRVHAMFGNSAEAVRCWQQCVTLDPRFAPAYRQIGSDLMENGKYTEAVEWFRKALAIDGALPDLANQLAAALMYAGNMKEARAVLEQEACYGSPSQAPHFLLGQISLQLHEFDEARRHLETTVKMAPGYTDAYYGLARAYAALGNHERAEECRQKFRMLKAEDQSSQRDELRHRKDRSIVRRYLAIAYSEAGWVYHVHGKTTPAESHWLAAAALDPERADSLTALARLYHQRNDRGKLVQVLQRLRTIELESHKPVYREAYKPLQKER